MTPPTVSAYLAQAHMQDLLREARGARLVGQARAMNGGIWSATLLLAADWLLEIGQRLHAYVWRTRAQRIHEARCTVGGVCRRDTVLQGHIV